MRGTPATCPWPHEPATIAYHAAEGPSWWPTLDENGARTTSQVTPTAEGGATASDLVLFVDGRRDQGEPQSRGDRRVFERLIAWEPA